MIRHGAVCVLGVICSGNRNLLDFMGLALDSLGYAHMTVTATEGPEGTPSSPSDNSFRHVVYWRQYAGPSAYSDPCAKKQPCVYARPGPQPVP